MSKPANLDRITVDGNTIDLQEARPSSDYQELIITGISPTREEVEVVYTIGSNTPESELEQLFAGDYSIEETGTTHRLVVSNNGVEVVYSTPSLER